MRNPARTLLVSIAGACALLFAFAAIRSAQPKPTLPAQADRIVVSKSAHTMTLYHQQQALATYHVALGRGGSGPKVHAGDNRVPEGTYPIMSKNPHSAFYRALRVGYPTAQQRSDAVKHGIDPGGDIMIHGIRKGLGWIGALQSHVDWTKGCIAVTDAEMDQIWATVQVGTLIEINP